jgi:arylsulfatase A-like enzyme
VFRPGPDEQGGFVRLPDEPAHLSTDHFPSFFDRNAHKMKTTLASRPPDKTTQAPISRLWVGLMLLGMTISCGPRKSPPAPVPASPNVVFILADDLGYGDLGCYGQPHFATPHIDQLATDGLLFTQHYAGSTVCAPSRSALMTGLHTGHTPIRGNRSTGLGQMPLPDGSFTIAELFKTKGYVTGAFGKWGLGYSGSEGDPIKQGFDTFFGYHDQRLAHHYYPNYLWKNSEVFVLEGNQGLQKEQYAPQVIHEEALAFIEDNRDQPFFLFYPTIIPHAELFAPPAYLDHFKGAFLPEKQYAGTDEGPDYKKGRYGSQDHCHAAFAGMVTLLDEQVGELVAKVRNLGLEDRTIFIFTSDNGPHQEGGADPDYFDSNGPLRGYKRDLYEGGVRVPAIIKWPDRITPGRQTSHVSAFWDFMPTFAELLGVELYEPTDGISLLPTLLEEGAQEAHDYLYWEFHELGGRRALRQGDWKLVHYDLRQGGRYELYNLREDPGETRNLAAELPEKVAELAERLELSRSPSEFFNL